MPNSLVRPYMWNLSRSRSRRACGKALASDERPSRGSKCQSGGLSPRAPPRDLTVTDIVLSRAALPRTHLLRALRSPACPRAARRPRATATTRPAPRSSRRPQPVPSKQPWRKILTIPSPAISLRMPRVGDHDLPARSRRVTASSPPAVPKRPRRRVRSPAARARHGSARSASGELAWLVLRGLARVRRRRRGDATAAAPGEEVGVEQKKIAWDSQTFIRLMVSFVSAA